MVARCCNRLQGVATGFIVLRKWQPVLHISPSQSVLASLAFTVNEKVSLKWVLTLHEMFLFAGSSLGTSQVPVESPTKGVVVPPEADIVLLTVIIFEHQAARCTKWTCPHQLWVTHMWWSRHCSSSVQVSAVGTGCLENRNRLCWSRNCWPVSIVLN